MAMAPRWRVRPLKDATVTRSRFVRIVATAVVAVPMLAGTLVQPAAAQDEPLRIGTIFPFTGDLSDFGPNFYNAAELAVTQINEAGGVNGQPVELLRGDSATSPQQTVEEARRLIDIEGAQALIGGVASGEALQLVESVAGPDGVLTISPSATSPALTTVNDDDFFFRTTISDAAQGVVMADIARELGYQTACVLYLNSAYGQGLTEAFVAGFTAQGGEVTNEVPHEQEQASYASELAACTESEPDVLVGVSYPESAGVYLRELVESGATPDLLLSDGLRSEDLFEGLGWEAFEGTVGTSPGSEESETGAAFQAAMEETYGDLPSVPYLPEVYDAVYLIALAAEAAGSNDSAAIRDALRDVASGGTVVAPGAEGFAAAVEAIGAGEDIDYEGASGSLDYDENGDVVRGAIIVWAVEDGAIVVRETRPLDLTGDAMAAPEATPAA
ncbi:MAG: ABC transporter substrate-binding protein [Chloroflexia bacterium]|nr:ABC transporter substrate-binding protein [Chloroflexia bacterium]